MFNRFIKKGHLPNDNEDEKLKKSTLLITALPFGLAGLVWGTMYFLNGLLLPGLIPFCYGILSLFSIWHFIVFKKFKFFRFSQIFLILILPFLLQISLGGYIPSSSVILWALISPLGALVFYDVKQSIFWFIAFIVLALIAFVFNDYIGEYFNWQLSSRFVTGMFVMNIVGISALIYLIQYYFVSKQAELKRSIEEKNAQILEKNKEITDSITYAKRIQYALLAQEKALIGSLSNHFVLFKPKDIVSGDFYWATKRNNKFYFAVCDSTGHGVPGAFMSLLNISYLNEAVNERNLELPNEICNHVRLRLIESISYDGAQDGMDGVLICLDIEKKQLTYTAAHNAPILIRNQAVIKLSADKMPIGKGQVEQGFSLHTIEIQKEDVIYLFTDGYADQFGGENNKKFKYKKLYEKLLEIHNKPFTEQKSILDKTIEQWKGNQEQTDDILVIGFMV